MPTNPNKKKPSIFDDGSQQKRGAIAGRNIYILMKKVKQSCISLAHKQAIS